MSEPRAPRVRVTGPARRRTPATRAGNIDQETRLGGVYVASLLRAQLSLALRILAALGLTIGMLPLLFHLAPGLVDVAVFGAPLPWLLIGVVAYPVLVALGWSYVRRAERNERNFADLVEHREHPAGDAR